jgi:hypothetical protein
LVFPPARAAASSRGYRFPLAFRDRVTLVDAATSAQPTRSFARTSSFKIHRFVEGNIYVSRDMYGESSFRSRVNAYSFSRYQRGTPFAWRNDGDVGQCVIVLLPGRCRDEETATATTISTTTTTMTRNRETMLSSAREGSRRSHHPRKRKLVTTTNLLPSAARFLGLLLGAGCVVCVAVGMHAASIRSGCDLLLSGIVRWSRANHVDSGAGSAGASSTGGRQGTSRRNGPGTRTILLRGVGPSCGSPPKSFPCTCCREFPELLTRSVVGTCFSGRDASLPPGC